MKKLYIIAALAALYVIGCVEAKANDVTCSAIANGDDRAYCRAVQRNSKAECSAIQSYNFRQQCLVRLGARQTLCATVSSPWERQQCKDAARARR